MGMVESLLTPGRRAGTDDTQRIVVAFCPGDENEAARDRPDGDEAVLGLGMGRVEDFEVVRGEQLRGFLEGEAVLAAVCEVLGSRRCWQGGARCSMLPGGWLMKEGARA